MRITTSPYMVSSKGFSSNVVSPVSYNSNGTRSSSLTNSDIMHKRLISDRQFNQNSYLIMNDNSKYQSPLTTKHLIQKNITNEYGIPENPNSIQQKLNNIQKSIQQINKKLIKQGLQLKTLQSSSNQNQAKVQVLQKFHQQIQVKIKEENQGLLKQIKQINKQIYQRIDQIKTIKLTQINNGSISVLNQSGMLANNQKPVNFQLFLKKVKLTIDQKLNSQIFKLRLFVENQVFKSANFYKISQNNQAKCYFTKSTLKYSLKPLKLVQRHSINVQQSHNKILGKSKDEECKNKKQKNTTQIQSSKQVYYLDDKGYLLDQEGFYLLDNQKNMIKFTQPMLQKLKDMKMLK